VAFSRWILVFWLFSLVLAGSARAQSSDGGPDTSKAKLRFGPLAIGPTLELTDFGVDTNVFDSPPGQEKSDFAFTLAPGSQIWLKMGPSWLTGVVKEQIIWYQTYATERSANTSYQLNWKVPLSRVTFVAGSGFVNAHDRPGFEIDARVQRRELSFNGSAEVRALPSTFVGVGGLQQRVSFGQDAVFMGTDLRTELSRVDTTATAFVRQELTPLTSVSLNFSREQDRFDYSPERDSNLTGMTGSITLDPSALVKGTATFGYRAFEPLSPAVPAYHGTTVNVNLGYTVFGTTRMTLVAVRDVQYSYDVNEPYYLLTGATGTVTQQIFGPIDVAAKIGVQHLAYRNQTGGVVLLPDRVDAVHIFGGGVGYHLGEDVRVSVNVEHQKRDSILPDHQYQGLRFGVSVAYGF